MKPFDLAMFCGRFQHAHVGHEHVINTGLMIADRVLILVGSAQEINTLRNPFCITTRIEMLRAIYPQANVIIKPLMDLTHEDDITPDWGEYVLKNTKNHMRKKPEVFIYGNDESRSKWFAPDDIKDVTEVVVSRDKINISATKIREFLVRDDFDNWSQYVNPKLHKYYERLRFELLVCDVYNDM